MTWGRHRKERAAREAEALAARDAATEELEESRELVTRARNIGGKLRKSRARNHFGMSIDHLIERGRP